MAYLIAEIVMTLRVLEGHSPIASLSSVIFLICGMSRGLSAFAEHLVITCFPLAIKCN